jgi:hypothetical protein
MGQDPAIGTERKKTDTAAGSHLPRKPLEPGTSAYEAERERLLRHLLRCRLATGESTDIASVHREAAELLASMRRGAVLIF